MKKLVGIACFIVLAVIAVISLFYGKTNALYGKWQDNRDIVEFKSDGTFTSQVYFMSGKYVVNGNRVTMSIPLIGNDVYEFSIKNNELTLKDMESNTKYVFTKVK